uniref:Uncharacterized protein n=1 Tax=Anguilla anguilla TaxID=7936 RepID=A0A0E9PK92_ANGAN
MCSQVVLNAPLLSPSRNYCTSPSHVKCTSAVHTGSSQPVPHLITPL